MNDPDQIVDDLQTVLADAGDGFAKQLEASLCQARERAQAELNTPLMQALPWPGDIDDYYAYLRATTAS